MRKRITGILLVAVGLLLIVISTATYASLAYQEEQAGQNAQLILNGLTQEIKRQEETAIYEPVKTEALPVGESQQITWNGWDLIGIIRIPSLGIELPVMNSWSYELLQIAPCRYSGSIEEENLILLAHNYKKHFGALKDLAVGDTVEFEDAYGRIHRFEVTATEILNKTELDKLTAPGYAMTLFTCTPGGYSRFVVRCNPLE